MSLSTEELAADLWEVSSEQRLNILEKLSENKPPVIFGDGSQVRDFTSVEDVAKANLMAMESSINQGFLTLVQALQPQLMTLQIS